MNKKSILGLLLFGSLVIASLFYGATLMTRYEPGTNADQRENENTNEIAGADTSIETNKNTKVIVQNNDTQDYAKEESGSSTDLSDQSTMKSESPIVIDGLSENNEEITEDGIMLPEDTKDIMVDSLGSKTNTGDLTVAQEAPIRELIIDSTQVDYMAYIPEMIYDSKLEATLDIKNPNISIKAEAAILIDVETKTVLYHKNPVKAVFPASTSKLLTAIVALEWCKLEEAVTVGEEITMITLDSTRANLRQGEILSIKNLLEGMLLPSGNDAAYVIATYVGRKALNNSGASCEDAVTEFVKLMNAKAKLLGAVNSSFKTPDGYDALGQYTTAYDMGMIALAAVEYEEILEITKKGSSRNIYISGKDVTWNNTNALVKRSSPHFYSYSIGLKTGTSTMAGKCLISAGRKNGREVLSVVMDSTTTGRWSDSIALLDYGLSR